MGLIKKEFRKCYSVQEHISQTFKKQFRNFPYDFISEMFSLRISIQIFKNDHIRILTFFLISCEIDFIKKVIQCFAMLYSELCDALFSVIRKKIGFRGNKTMNVKL